MSEENIMMASSEPTKTKTEKTTVAIYKTSALWIKNHTTKNETAADFIERMIAAQERLRERIRVHRTEVLKDGMPKEFYDIARALAEELDTFAIKEKDGGSGENVDSDRPKE